MDFVVSQIPLYRTVLEYRTFVEEKICLTRGANTTQNRLRCDRCHGGLGKMPNQRPIDSYDLQQSGDNIIPFSFRFIPSTSSSAQHSLG